MNTITFKGVSSDTLAGLIIQTLPAISKPQMRTAVTQIDGMDGDITDLLGYTSYEKDVIIGLKPGYDIDAIAKYFSGAGTLVLSNEPTRVYNVDLYNQVDFEQLFRYRTATVKFWAQPYKYLLGETPTTLNISGQTSLSVTNQGLENSKPLIRLVGSGTVTIKLGGIDQFVYVFPGGDTDAFFDSDSQDAYVTAGLRNAAMTGDFIILPPGASTIGWSGGTLTRIEVTPRSRWL